MTSTLWHRCHDFVEEQSSGEWDDKTIVEDADKLLQFVCREHAQLIKALADIDTIAVRKKVGAAAEMQRVARIALALVKS